ncbi:MAG: sulfurtransferase, partial [Chloroflexi bacterium]|nr:sulfurtransferase [Chloroflexota bacterium]
VSLPEPSAEGVAAAEAYAARLAAEDGVRYMDVGQLQKLQEKRDTETIYLVDIRTQEEYQQGHIPGFRWFPGGQAVQRSDEVAVVRNSTIVFCCDGKARATVTASWYRQLGLEQVYVVDGGTSAWSAAGLDLEQGMPGEQPAGLAQAREKVRFISAQELNSAPPKVTIFVDTSQDFARGHVPGARWAPRGWLEIQIGDLASEKAAAIAVTANDEANATLAGATLTGMGYGDVAVLKGGMASWRQMGLPLETGLSGVMGPPTDLVLSGPDRNYADMMNYLRWETALGEKYADLRG